MSRMVQFGLIGTVITLMALMSQGSALAAGGGVSQSIPYTVVVTKQYGAAVHLDPSSDSDSLYTASCGEVLPVIDAVQGWYEVLFPEGAGWVGGARVTDADYNPFIDCTDAIAFQPGDIVGTAVVSGCLSLRYSPSRDAGYTYCVPNGYLYTVLDGPITVNGEDWIEVTSPDTGLGWVLAQFLYPTGS